MLLLSTETNTDPGGLPTALWVTCQKVAAEPFVVTRLNGRRKKVILHFQLEHTAQAGRMQTEAAWILFSGTISIQ